MYNPRENMKEECFSSSACSRKSMNSLTLLIAGSKLKVWITVLLFRSYIREELLPQKELTFLSLMAKMNWWMQAAVGHCVFADVSLNGIYEILSWLCEAFIVWRGTRCLPGSCLNLWKTCRHFTRMELNPLRGNVK